MNAQTYRNHFTNTDDNGWHFPFFSFLLYYFLLLVIYLLFRNVRPPGKSQPTIVNSIAEIVVRLTQPKCIVHVEIFSFWHSYKRDESIRMSHDFQEIHGILCRFMFNLHFLKSFLCCDVILFFQPSCAYIFDFVVYSAICHYNIHGQKFRNWNHARKKSKVPKDYLRANEMQWNLVQLIYSAFWIFQEFSNIIINEFKSIRMCLWLSSQTKFFSSIL